jgi:hypothetical protein
MEESLAFSFGYTAIGLTSILLMKSLVNAGSHDSSYAIWHYFSWVHYIKWAGLMTSEGTLPFIRFYRKLILVFKPEPLNTYSPPCSIPKNFQIMGFDYSYFLNNSEVPLIIWGIFSIIYLFFLAVKVKSFENIRKSVCENMIIRATLVFFMDFLLYALLQIRQFEISTVYGIINSIISVVVVSCLLIFWVFVSIFVLVKTEESGNLYRIKTIRQEFDVTQKKYLIYYFLFMLERTFAGISYVFLGDYPKVQCFMIEITSGVVCKDYLVIYVAFVKPFIKKELNVFVMILETFSIIIGSLIGSFSIYGVSDSSKDNMLFFIVSVLYLSIPIFLFFTFKVSDGNSASRTMNGNFQNNTKVFTENEKSFDNKFRVIEKQRNHFFNNDIKDHSDLKAISPRSDLSTNKVSDFNHLEKMKANNLVLKARIFHSEIGFDNKSKENYLSEEIVNEKTEELNEKSVTTRIPYYEALFDKYHKNK